MACSQAENEASEDKPAKESIDTTTQVEPVDTTTVTTIETPTEAKPSLCGKTYQYTPYKSHQFTIVFSCDDEVPQGVVFGPEPAEEHGLFYFMTNLDSIQQTGNNISFSFVTGGLYQEPFTLENYTKPITIESAGMSKARTMYRGSLNGDSLTLTCKSKWYDCYSDSLFFVEKH
jgi:hypothetical protein